ncbi:hypothetical protein BGZ94_001177 [Podila epigama]|nr:hypothetical protein BGZ94_001177 [Podila epigama]
MSTVTPRNKLDKKLSDSQNEKMKRKDSGEPYSKQRRLEEGRLEHPTTKETSESVGHSSSIVAGPKEASRRVQRMSTRRTRQTSLRDSPEDMKKDGERLPKRTVESQATEKADQGSIEEAESLRSAKRSRHEDAPDSAEEGGDEALECLDGTLINDDKSDHGDEDSAIPKGVLDEIHEFEQGFNGLQGRFKLLEKIGSGTFSSVYTAIDLEHEHYDNSSWAYVLQPPPCKPESGKSETSSSEQSTAQSTKSTAEKAVSEKPVPKGTVVAIKRIYVSSSPERIESEIKMLHDLSGHNNVVPLITAFRFRDQVLVVLPYFEHQDFRGFFRWLSMNDIRYYFRSLLKALAHVHSHNIIHRDIKPNNFLFDIRTKTGILVDFGLAERQSSQPFTARMSKSKRTSRTDSGRAKTKAESNTAGTSKEEADSVIAPSPSLSTRENPSLSATEGSSVQPKVISTQPEPHDDEPSVSLTSKDLMANKDPVVMTQKSKGRNTESTLDKHRKESSAAPQESATLVKEPHSKSTNISTASTNVPKPPSQKTMTTVGSSSKRSSHQTPNTHTATATVLNSYREVGYLKRDKRPILKVNRAGTRGFRAPEILIKHEYQTVAVDIWSVGVILLCFLTGRFPFFDSNDDAEGLLEIAIVFGGEEMKRFAHALNRSFLTNVPSVKPYGIEFGRLARLLHAKRFSAPADYVPKHRFPLRPANAEEAAKWARDSSDYRKRSKRTATHASTSMPSIPTPPLDTKVQSPPKGLPTNKNTIPEPERSTTSNEDKRHANGSPPDVDTHAKQKRRSPPSKTTHEESMDVAQQVVDGHLHEASRDAPAHGHRLTRARAVEEASTTEDPFLPYHLSKLTKASTDGVVLKQIIGWDSQDELECAISFLDKLLTLDPSQRITAEEALQHPFLLKDGPPREAPSWAK